MKGDIVKQRACAAQFMRGSQKEPYGKTPFPTAIYLGARYNLNSSVANQSVNISCAPDFDIARCLSMADVGKPIASWLK
jgi:hypothetical protein